LWHRVHLCGLLVTRAHLMGHSGLADRDLHLPFFLWSTPCVSPFLQKKHFIQPHGTKSLVVTIGLRYGPLCPQPDGCAKIQQAFYLSTLWLGLCTVSDCGAQSFDVPFASIHVSPSSKLHYLASQTESHLRCVFFCQPIRSNEQHRK
jgi:hypothetical protein